MTTEPFAEFVALFSRLDKTNRTNEKIAAVKDYLQSVGSHERIWAIYMLSGRRLRRPFSTTKMKTWIIETAGIETWLFEECYHVVGDLAETASLLLPTEKNSHYGTLGEHATQIGTMKKKTENEQRQWFVATVMQLPPDATFVFLKLLTGGLRIGVSQNNLVKALSAVTGLEGAVLSHKLMGDWTPLNTSYETLMETDDQELARTKPYPFYLAYPLEDFTGLGDPVEWAAEWKWDGIRAQLIKRDQKLSLWSRGEELITEQFPEFKAISWMLPDGIVLDGEIVAYRNAMVLPFSELQKRLGRKQVTNRLMQEQPIQFKAYDLLEYENQDWRDLTYDERRERLSSLLADLPSMTHLLTISETLPFSSWKELQQWYAQARSYHAEGIFLKWRKGDYKVGRRRGEWWKWKVAPLSLDCVLIYAQKGHGRRANLYSDYTFALYDTNGELIPITKAYSGLTDKEMKEVDRFVKKHSREKFGPVRTVEPKLVFEIAFEGIQTSNRHKSGIALRFPRIARIREDKPVEEIDTLKTARQLLNTYSGGENREKDRSLV